MERTPRRPGAILLVVVALLTLFAVVGLSFVLYASSAATSARYFREAEAPTRPDLDPDLLLGHFLGQLVYDAADDAQGVQSALRGHGLARSLFGYDGSTEEAPGNLNDRPFSGTGRLHAPSVFADLGLPDTPDEARDDYYLVNYTFFRDDPALAPRQRFLRDPERLGTRPDPDTPRGPFTGGFNVSYTYPDLNNLFLGAVKADGTLLVPSFHRPWAGFGTLAPSNPNWYDRTKPWLKYLVLRPRPADMGPGFAAPEDAGGDVKNLVGAPGGNDSLWLDLGFPVLTAPDGRRYKPLFAPLVLDLDNRINVNVHGNVRGVAPTGGWAQGQAHRSNQGWGPWEVNLGRVLTQDPKNVPEWPNLLTGATQPFVVGKYGPDRSPGSPPADDLAPAWPTPRFFAQADFDAARTDGSATDPPQLPGQGGAAALSCFPSFPPGYDNASADERRRHPLLHQVFRPRGDDRVFTASNLEALLRHGDTGSPALTSELFRLCPVNFGDPTDPRGSTRRRRLVTTHSFDQNQPGATPWLYPVDPGDPAAYGIPAADPTGAPRGPALPFPPLAWRTNPPPGFPAPAPLGEFGPDWRANHAGSSGWHGGGGRINLRRALPPYPHQGGAPDGSPLVGPFDRFDTNDPQVVAQFTEAVVARQQFADELYRKLLAVTGLPAPRDPAAPTDAELEPRRWLAQLAVNLVDYIDEDDISTPFCFYDRFKDAGGAPAFDGSAVSRPDGLGGGWLSPGELQWPRYWVFGVELPHVLLNEVLVQFHEETDTDGSLNHWFRFFIELHNPFPDSVPATVQQRDRLAVPLRMPALPSGPSASGGSGDAYAPYRVVVGLQPSPGPIGPGATNENVLGNPERVRASTNDADFTDGGLEIRPQGFVLLGPPEPGGAVPVPLQTCDAFLPPNNAAVPPNVPVLRTPRLGNRFVYPVPPPPGDDERVQNLQVLLRRLANPHLPFNPDRNAGVWYNPYLTVDYLEQVPLRWTSDPGPFTARGKRQPYAAALAQVSDQQAPTQGNVVHTFGLRNEPPPEGGRYDWLVHLDRPPIGPPEVLHVAACPPYQLTHRFISPDRTGTVRKFNHRAPWLEQETRLYRLLEFLEAHAAGEAVVEVSPFRVPGRINLNTVWDEETFLALCDWPDDAQARAMFQRLIAGRTPDLAGGGGLGPRDRPFRSLATGYTATGDTQYPRGSGLEDTLLRSAEGGEQRLFQPTGSADDHPYLRDRLFIKVFNNVTTRSNVFAVWLTVGFFEVTDETTRPVRLGAEIGRAENRHVRHRMFAIVDRSVLNYHPGPRDRFRPRDDPALVPYFSIIE
jgi:hypothetical protein